MENWIIHYDRNYDAVPWPFKKSWDEFVRSPDLLVNTCDDFGRVALCDSLSETPTVPPHLPRLVPNGRYRFAIYHDADWLYAFLEAENGPVIVSSKEIDAIPHLRNESRLRPVLVLLTPDQRFIFRFGLDAHGRCDASMANLVYGKRIVDLPRREFRCDLQIHPTTNGEISCWRIARASVADAFLGDTIRLSVSRTHFETLEAVAWGSHTGWGPRSDEFGTIRLVEKRVTPPWPVARRVEMIYQPNAEKARFRVHWEGIYQPSETGVQLYPNKAYVVPWNQWSLRLNGEQRMFAMQELVETTEFDINDGYNQIDIASVGGPSVRLELEKRSGNRIVENHIRSSESFDCSAVKERIRSEYEGMIECFREHSALGEKRVFYGWQTYQAASLGRIYHYLDPDPRLLEALRVEADYALTLQREDGTFGGFHMVAVGGTAAPWAGGGYDTGPAGELWDIAAWLLKDAKYMDASKRLLHAYKDYRIEFNYNYAAFTLYHLVTHYRLTRDPLALENALYYSKHCVAVDLLPLGFHAGHNYYTCYGSITLRGMAQLCAVLPEDDPYRKTLREQCIRMANQVLSRQQPDGSVDARQRFFLDLRFWSWGLFSVAFLLPPDDVARLDAAIQRMMKAPPVPIGLGESGFFAESDFVRYLVHRDDLLAGRKVDLMGMI